MMFTKSRSFFMYLCPPILKDLSKMLFYCALVIFFFFFSNTAQPILFSRLFFFGVLCSPKLFFPEVLLQENAAKSFWHWKHYRELGLLEFIDFSR